MSSLFVATRHQYMLRSCYIERKAIGTVAPPAPERNGRKGHTTLHFMQSEGMRKCVGCE